MAKRKTLAEMQAEARKAREAEKSLNDALAKRRGARAAAEAKKPPKRKTPQQIRREQNEATRGKLMPKTGLDKLTEALTPKKPPKKKKRR